MNCSYCGKTCKNFRSLKQHERLCKSNPNRQEPTRGMLGKKGSNQFIMAEKLGLPKPESGTKGNNHWLGRKHSTESKKKISEGVKKAHDEGRGHTWKNRYENPSYAERWLYGFLDSRNIKYEKEVPFMGFFLDVVIGNKIIEIDGEQHYMPEKFPEQIERDQRKDKLLKENGFEELRLRWSLIQKDKENQIKILESFLK